jgi:hypothetical protein
MAATATLPRSAGNGVALIVIALDAAIGLLAALEKALARPQAQAAAPAAAISKQQAQDLGMWQLYRMTGSGDSVSPRVCAYLRNKA